MPRTARDPRTGEQIEVPSSDRFGRGMAAGEVRFGAKALADAGKAQLLLPP
jgi:hypothetical protein